MKVAGLLGFKVKPYKKRKSKKKAQMNKTRSCISVCADARISLKLELIARKT